MDAADRRLLDIMQADFPVTERPYAELGRRLGISEDEVLSRTQRLKDEGVIRRLGASFDPHALGYVSTLVACRVPPEQIDGFAEVANGYEEVTHNYERDHDYNVWFTVIAPSRERIAEVLAEIRQRTGVSDLHDLPAERLHKIEVRFDLAKGEGS